MLKNKKMMNFIAVPLAILGLAGGIGFYNFQSENSNIEQDKSRILPSQTVMTPSQLFFEPNDSINKIVDSIYNSLTDQQKAAQMIMTASSTSAKLGYPYNKAKQYISEGYVGNLVFLKGSVQDFTSQVKELNAINQPLKPLYACDCEPSLMNGKWAGSKPVKKANQQKNVQDIRDNTAIINSDMHSVGVQLNFAPVADNSINQDVISNRAFGTDPKSIIELSKEFIRFSQEDNIATSVKHFPGHGNVKGDSHKNLVFINGDMKELETFKSIIQSEHPPYTVMVGHIAIKNNEKWDTKGLPATISRNIVFDLLRKEFKYKGIITTDAMNMLGVSNIPNADFKAVEAGVDLVLMPKNPKDLNQKIVAALAKQDPLSRQIELSIKRIIRLKVIMGIA